VNVHYKIFGKCAQGITTNKGLFLLA